MTEKIESMEVHPMRGHSRGDWYCSLDDVAPSEEKAEYWAVFGITHRGNRHCLGEFPTKHAATAVVEGHKEKTRASFESPTMSRKIVQIEVVTNNADSNIVELFALCNDSSIWRRGIGTRQASGFMDERWEQVPLDSIDGLSLESDDDWWLYPKN